MDQFFVPRMQFAQEPVSNVVNAVNAAVRTASGGTVNRAVTIDAAPVPIRKFAPSSEISTQMDSMISAYQEFEQQMIKKGANGYESALYTGFMGGGHSLGCTFQELATATDLNYEERSDGIHLGRASQLECHAYRISKGLVRLMEQKQQANDLHVDAEPIVSALAQATGIHSWSIDVPDGPNSWTSEIHFDKVFRHLPNSEIILALATSEEHAQAKVQLKASGLWEEMGFEPTP